MRKRIYLELKSSDESALFPGLGHKKIRDHCGVRATQCIQTTSRRALQLLLMEEAEISLTFTVYWPA
jgi:hypothetical protein